MRYRDRPSGKWEGHSGNHGDRHVTCKVTWSDMRSEPDARHVAARAGHPGRRRVVG